MNKDTIIDNLLENMAVEMETNGWCQHIGQDGTAKCTSIAAWDAVKKVDVPFADRADFFGAIGDRIRNTAKLPAPTQSWKSPADFTDIVKWNDAESRTKEEVIQVLRDSKTKK
jgi:hypothetical protein